MIEVILKRVTASNEISHQTSWRAKVAMKTKDGRCVHERAGKEREGGGGGGRVKLINSERFGQFLSSLYQQIERPD